jgi:hypothetical protein
MLLGKKCKKYLNSTSILLGVNHIFGSIIWIWKDLGPMYFWSSSQSFSGGIYITKLAVHLPNS